VGTISLPDDEPILWRETMNTYLDWPHGFRGTLGFAIFPLIFVILAAALGPSKSGECGWISFLICTMWIIGAIAVTVRSSRAFASERAHRTLDVLLTTPLTGSEIVRQKMKSSWRLALVFAAPIATLCFIEALLEIREFTLTAMLSALIYLAAATLSVLIFLPAISWVALLVGMRLRDSRRATLLALGVTVVWNAGPLALMASVTWFTRGDSFSILLLALPSPAFVVALLESGRAAFPIGMLGPLLASAGLVMNLAILIWIRRLCLKNADRYLGRPVASGETEKSSTDALRVEGGAA
jgi:ABC-type transport system involved in cytochrome c biogenesis permease component